MLAGTLALIAKDLIQEYSKLSIVNKLNEAITASSQRNPSQPHLYPPRANELRTWADGVIKNTRFNNYPSYLMNIIHNSRYDAILPIKIAQLISKGFPSDQQYAISSTELLLYRDRANALVNELTALHAATTNFGVEERFVPADDVGLDIFIPRTAFDNHARAYSESLDAFLSAATYMCEISHGASYNPSLTYTSTSDPVFGIAMLAAGAYGFLNFYKNLLEVAEKQLTLIKTVKEFRAAKLSDTQGFEEKINDIIENNIQDAVNRSIAPIQTKLNEQRINEIKNGLYKDARVMVKLISNGSRIDISVETLDNQIIFDKTDEIQISISELSRETKKIAEAVSVSFALLERAGQPLIESAKSK
jgi:hypothetical protein